MFGLFTDFFPDELIYSANARLSKLICYSSSKSLVSELFGSSSAANITDLPCRLSNLLAAFPVGHCYTVDYLISNHTLLPFYGPFLPIQRVEQLKQDMAGDNGLKAQLRCGIAGSSISTPEWLRFCPLCINADKKKYGDFYWHRLHQVPGVNVCPTHHVFLENSVVRARGKRIRYELIPASQAVQPVEPRLIDLSKPLHQALLKIARDVAWLLDHPDFHPGLESIRERYIKLLVDKGLATYTGQVHALKLIKEIKDYYSSDLLKLLQCEIRDQHDAWPLRLARSPRHSCHPLYHLLLIQFLGYSIGDFFQISSELKPFGDGPWPCLNPVCKKFRQLCIPMYELKHDKVHGSRIVATFSCECGFVYSRMGPDTSPDDKFKVGKIKERGKVWEALLKELWYDSAVTLMEMAECLGSDSQTVKYHASRLNLNYPRLGPTAKQIQKTVTPPAETVKVDSPKRREYRNEWLNIVQNNPTASKFELSEQHRRIHSWLYLYDREWLNLHSPKLKDRTFVINSVNWHKRDIEVSAAVRTAAEELKSKTGKPERASKTAIASNSGYLALIQKQLDRLPLTAETLAEVVETTEEFVVRRVQWVAECFKQEGISPKKWQIINQAHIKPYIAEMPKVKEAIASALNLS